MVKSIKQAMVALILMGLVLSALTRIVSASLATLPDDTETGEPSYSELLCPPSDEVANLLRDIAIRSDELEARDLELQLREQDLQVAGQELRSTLEELRAAEQSLAARMYQSDQASEDDIARLTQVYEGMKPKDAAVLFETMEANFAAGFLGRMNPDAAAAIFSSLSAEKAYALSVVMAGRNANAARGPVE